MLHRLTILLCLAALLPTGSRALGAQTIAANGNPGLLRISSAVAGSQPVSVSDATSTYTVTTPAANRTYKITAQLNANMPADVTLTVSLQAPPAATSLGAIALDITARDVVTGVKRNTNATRSVTYQLSALASAGVIPTGTRTVTFTIIQFP